MPAQIGPGTQMPAQFDVATPQSSEIARQQTLKRYYQAAPGAQDLSMRARTIYQQLLQMKGPGERLHALTLQQRNMGAAPGIDVQGAIYKLGQIIHSAKYPNQWTTKAVISAMKDAMTMLGLSDQAGQE